LSEQDRPNDCFCLLKRSSFKVKEGGVLSQATSLFSSPKHFQGL
jgi:hypothetical protein